MKIEITEVSTNDEGVYKVAFVCPAGIGMGIWHGDNPEERRCYGVEINIDARLERSSIIGSTGITSYKISCAEDALTFHCLIDGVDDDGVSYLRLDQGLLIMVESDFTKADIGSWACFTVPIQAVELFPFGA